MRAGFWCVADDQSKIIAHVEFSDLFWGEIYCKIKRGSVNAIGRQNEMAEI